MRVITVCEESGEVRDAFARAGHDSTSCDVLPSAKPGNHIQSNALDIDLTPYDLIIAFPPCTSLCSSGARWWPTKEIEQRKAIYFFLYFTKLSNKFIAIENPIGKMSSLYRKPDQIIQPWQFGHGETKATCLWLTGLPLLKPTHLVPGRRPRIHFEPPGPHRSRNRSRTYPGIATAMAKQWGVLL